MRVVVHAANGAAPSKVYFNLEEYTIPFGEEVDLPEGVVQMLHMSGAPTRTEGGQQNGFAKNYNVVVLDKPKQQAKGGKPNDSTIAD